MQVKFVPENKQLISQGGKYSKLSTQSEEKSHNIESKCKDLRKTARA